MDTTENSPWRPAHAEIEQGKSLLAGNRSKWAKLRLALLAALANSPSRSDRELAKAVGTRTNVVQGLLERWRTQGLTTIAQYGCPRALKEADLKELVAEVSAGRLHSLEETAAWVEKRKPGFLLSLSCLRGYSKKMGIELPAKVKPKATAKPKLLPIRPYCWSADQTAELQGYNGRYQQRVRAVLRVGTESLSINKIAEQCKVPATTLRLDLKRFSHGDLQQMVACWEKENVLVRRGIWPSFVKWCNEHYDKASGRGASGEDARAYLRKEHQLEMPLRTMYTHLTQWMLELGIQPRTRARVVEKFFPSEGIKVRSLNLFRL